MKNFSRKFLLFILLFNKIFISSSFGTGSLILNVPLKDTLHGYYDVCSASQHLIQVCYSYTDTGTKKIYIPHSACVRDTSSHPVAFHLFSTTNSIFDTYYFTAPVDTIFKFILDLTSIDCSYFGDIQLTPSVIVTGNAGDSTGREISNVNRPNLKFLGGEVDTLVKGMSTQRSYLLTAAFEADYDQFKVDANIENEIFITDVSVVLLKGGG